MVENGIFLFALSKASLNVLSQITPVFISFTAVLYGIKLYYSHLSER